MNVNNKSIKTQYAIIFGLLLTGAITIICIIDVLTINTYYTHHKRQVLSYAYEKINEAASNDDTDSNEFKNALNRMAVLNNLEIIVLDTDLEVVESTSQDFMRMSRRLKDVIFGDENGFAFVTEGAGFTILNNRDDNLNLEFIELWGILSNDYIISIRTPVESIKDSTIISNRLMLVVGLVSIFTGVVLVIFLSATVTKPIMNLVKISEKMTRLDFSEKYVSRNENEIDILGEHMNQLSDALEKTISDLKTANIELKRDIDEKVLEQERRKEFISNVSHELKTPIALVQGYAEGLKDCVNDDEESRDYYCDVIIDEANQMNKLVRSLLELDQLESGSNKAVMEHFDIIEVIKSCASKMDILIKQNGINLILPDKAPVLVWADEFQTEQIINNYLSNAIHYAQGEKVIKISCEKNHGIATVRVFNTGEPIPEDAIDQLWNKFYKVDKARTRSYGGSGIGLSIVKAIMDKTGLGYGVKNYNNGVEFYFEIDASDTLPGTDCT